MKHPGANALYHVAQREIRAGQPVFPCRHTYESEKRKAKAPLIGGGLNSASTDPDQIKAWWSKFRGAAVGIPTGILWDVLDVDVKGEQDGRVHLPRLQALGLLNGCKRVARTPSGGWHLYFTAAHGLTNKANASLGLDVRAKGGYVFAAGSYIDVREDPDGGYDGLYTDEGETIGSTDEPLMWDLIVGALIVTDSVTRKEVDLLGYERQGSLASLRGWLSERRSGERNNALHWAVCRCIENGIDPFELEEVALHIGLPEHEIHLTMNSALKRAGLQASELKSEVETLFPDEV